MITLIYLAQTAADAGTNVLTIGTAAIAAVGTAVAAVIAAYRKGRREVSGIALEQPVPTVPTKRVYDPPTFYQHSALCKRVDKVELAVDDLRREQAEQFRQLLQAGEVRAERLTEKLDGIARGIHNRIDGMMPGYNHKDQP